MSPWTRFVNNVPLRRFSVLAFIVIVLFLVRSMMSTFLLTFIFCLLVVKLTNAIRRVVKIPSRLIVIVVYLLVLLGLYLAITVYIPKIADQASAPPRTLSISTRIRRTCRMTRPFSGSMNSSNRVTSCRR